MARSSSSQFPELRACMCVCVWGVHACVRVGAHICTCMFACGGQGLLSHCTSYLRQVSILKLESIRQASE